MITETTYTDPTGTKKKGYIKEGVTYTDKSLTNRIADGSVVDTAGGSYYKNPQNSSGVKIEQATGKDDSFTLYGKDYKINYGNGGSAYMDADLTAKVPFGSYMQKGGSTYYNDKNLGTVPTAGGALNDYKNSGSDTESLLEKARSAQEKASSIATDQRISALRAREQEAREQKAAADRQSYDAYLRSVNPYGANAQNTARLGLSNSGFAESNLAKLGSAYQNSLAENEKSLTQTLRSLAQLADEARAEGNRQKYDIYANMYTTLYNANQEKAKNTAQLSMQVANMLNDSKIRDEQYAREDAELALKNQMTAAENRRDAATLIAKYVFSGELTIPQVARLLNVSEADVREVLSALY